MTCCNLLPVYCVFPIVCHAINSKTTYLIQSCSAAWHFLGHAAEQDDVEIEAALSSMLNHQSSIINHPLHCSRSSFFCLKIAKIFANFLNHSGQHLDRIRRFS